MAYRNAHRILHEISTKMIALILEAARMNGSASSDDEKLFSEIEQLTKLRGKTQSVVSLIHYLPVTYADISTETSETEYLHNWGPTQARSALHHEEAPIKSDHYAHCRVHEDSNLFSLILCSDVAGKRAQVNFEAIRSNFLDRFASLE